MGSDYAKAFEKRLKEFSEDTSYFKDYDYLEIKKDKEVLVRIMDIEDEDSSFIITGYKLDRQGRVVVDKPDVDLNPTNIGMVIKSTDPDYKAGDLISLPYLSVKGTVETPEYMLMLQFSRGNMEPILPADFRKRMPRLEQSYGDHMVKHPKNLKPTTEDRLTYLLPSFKIQSGYVVSSS